MRAAKHLGVWIFSSSIELEIKLLLGLGLMKIKLRPLCSAVFESICWIHYNTPLRTINNSFLLYHYPVLLFCLILNVFLLNYLYNRQKIGACCCLKTVWNLLYFFRHG
jgi:hypothetical protein